MKKSIVIILLGTSVGFGLGYVAHKPTQAVTVDKSKKATPVTVEKKDGAVQSREQKLLLSAIRELDLTTKELQDAEDYIKNLELNTKRYDWLIARIKKSDYNPFMLGDGDSDFAPSEEMAIFLGWDDEKLKAFKKVAKETSQKIKAWEKENAKLLTNTDHSWTYEIPAFPDSIKEDYLSKASEILNASDMEIIRSSIDGTMNGIQQKQTVSIALSDDPPKMFFPEGMPTDAFSSANLAQQNGSTSQQQWVTVKTRTGDEKYPSSSYTGQYNPDEENSWSHLIPSS